MLLFSYLLAAILTRSLFGLDKKKKKNPQVKKIKLKKNSKEKTDEIIKNSPCAWVAYRLFAPSNPQPCLKPHHKFVN